MFGDFLSGIGDMALALNPFNLISSDNKGGNSSMKQGINTVMSGPASQQRAESLGQQNGQGMGQVADYYNPQMAQPQQPQQGLSAYLSGNYSPGQLDALAPQNNMENQLISQGQPKPADPSQEFLIGNPIYYR